MQLSFKYIYYTSNMFKTINNINKVLIIQRSHCHTYTLISKVHLQNEPDKIAVKGWVKALRKQKENVFIDITDGSCSERLQIYIPSVAKPANLTTGASITASGHLSKTPKGQLELVASKIAVTGECVIADGYPFAPRKTYPSEYLRQFLHLRSRTNKFASLLRVRDAATRAVHDFFHSKSYFNIHTPVLTSNDCEGAGEIFTVQPENKELVKTMLKEGRTPEEAYFNSKTYLTVSGQLHLEAIAHGMSKVYTFGPTFRAENSKSRLHLSEFYMIEAETAFINNLTDVTSFIETLIKYTTEKVITNYQDDLTRLNESNIYFDWLHKPFITLAYAEAMDIIEKHNLCAKDGITKEHELFLVNYCGNVPTFIINWPKEFKSFYMKQCPEDVTKVAALDLLVPNVGEIVGGSLREDDYNLLKDKLPPGRNDLDWYLELRKYGGVPTAGFGMGFERYLQFITGISNIKDTIPFPRWPHNCSL